MKTVFRTIFVLVVTLSLTGFGEIAAQNVPTKGRPATSTKADPPQIGYTISMSKPWTHLLEVEMRVASATLPSKLEIVMPVWTPGSYLVREYARHVQDFRASDSAGGTLAWEKTNKNTWGIDTGGRNEVVVRYNVYSNELTVRTNELNSEHAFFNPTALLMHPKGWVSAPSTVKVVPYGNWKVATGLRKVEGQTNTFRAENFDILYDSPFEVADFKEITFTVQGKPHRYVFCGDGNYNMERIAADTAKIVEESSKIFGDLPYDDYTLIVNLRGRGGLEHLNSTALQWNRFGFTGAGYTGFLNLVAHEFFHLWNVKRIKPDALGPFDYSNENYTRLLWVAEGITSYYETVLMRRAGLTTDREILATKAAQFQSLQDQPGRFQTSLEEASFDAWIKYYRPDENAVNNQISYYDKGEIVGFLLDMEIMRSSGGAKSLDDVMRHLYDEFAKKGLNFTPDDMLKVSEKMAGKSLRDFFSKYVSGRAEIDYNSILGNFGLELQPHAPGAREQSYLGANFATQYSPQGEQRVNVTSVVSGSPAWEQGLNFGDQIVALDGLRVTAQSLNQFLAERKPGDKVRLTVFRFDQLRQLEVTLGGRAAPNFRIVRVAGPTEDQKRLYRQFMGTELN